MPYFSETEARQFVVPMLSAAVRFGQKELHQEDGQLLMKMNRLLVMPDSFHELGFKKGKLDLGALRDEGTDAQRYFLIIENQKLDLDQATMQVSAYLASIKHTDKVYLNYSHLFFFFEKPNFFFIPSLCISPFSH